MTQIMRVSITGAMPSGEVWSVNPTFTLPGDGAGITFEDLEQLVTDINALVVPAGLTALMTSGVTVGGCRVEQRTLGGSLIAAAEGPRTTATTGTSSAPHPFQSAVVCSLRTTTPGGRGRGRLYWAATGAPLSSTTLRMSAATVSAALNGFSSLLAAINAEINAYDAAAALCVWSRVSNAAHNVTRIQVGDVLDVQRRRRDTLAESYQTASYAPLP